MEEKLQQLSAQIFKALTPLLGGRNTCGLKVQFLFDDTGKVDIRLKRLSRNEVKLDLSKSCSFKME